MTPRLAFLPAAELAAMPLSCDRVLHPLLAIQLNVLWCDAGLRAITRDDVPLHAAPASGEARRRFPGLDALFASGEADAALPVALAATIYQRAVWQRIAAIPYGRTLSYSALAESAGNPAAIRAAGTACGRNPLPLVIPCHRVLGSGGSLGGFIWGLPAKRALLARETDGPLFSRAA